MHLSTRQLDAFVAVARTLNFTKAADRLNITQSALSQRVRKLEEELGAALFIRAPGAVRLTETGQRILRFCQARESLEMEIRNDLAATREGELVGVVRIAAHSSILRPVLIPVIASLLRQQPRITCELIGGEAKSLPDILKRGEAEFVILDRPLEQTAIASHHLGDEIYVVIESRRHESPPDVYLDLDPDDRVTEQYFQAIGLRPEYRRSYMSDVYGIIDGVAEGMGRAVVSRHLLVDRSDVSEVESMPPVPSGVHLHYYTQPFYSRLQQAIRQLLIREFPRYLGRD